MFKFIEKDNEYVILDEISRFAINRQTFDILLNMGISLEQTQDLPTEIDVVEASNEPIEEPQNSLYIKLDIFGDICYFDGYRFKNTISTYSDIESSEYDEYSDYDEYLDAEALNNIFVGESNVIDNVNNKETLSYFMLKNKLYSVADLIKYLRTQNNIKPLAINNTSSARYEFSRLYYATHKNFENNLIDNKRVIDKNALCMQLFDTESGDFENVRIHNIVDYAEIFGISGIDFKTDELGFIVSIYRFDYNKIIEYILGDAFLCTDLCIASNDREAYLNNIDDSTAILRFIDTKYKLGYTVKNFNNCSITNYGYDRLNYIDEYYENSDEKTNIFIKLSKINNIDSVDPVENVVVFDNNIKLNVLDFLRVKNAFKSCNNYENVLNEADTCKMYMNIVNGGEDDHRILGYNLDKWHNYYFHDMPVFDKEYDKDDCLYTVISTDYGRITVVTKNKHNTRALFLTRITHCGTSVLMLNTNLKYNKYSKKTGYTRERILKNKQREYIGRSSILLDYIVYDNENNDNNIRVMTRDDAHCISDEDGHITPIGLDEIILRPSGDISINVACVSGSDHDGYGYGYFKLPLLISGTPWFETEDAYIFNLAFENIIVPKTVFEKLNISIKLDIGGELKTKSALKFYKAKKDLLCSSFIVSSKYGSYNKSFDDVVYEQEYDDEYEDA